MPPRHPFQAIPPARRRTLFLGLLAGTLLVMAALGAGDGRLRTHSAPLGIVSFEFAATPERAGRMLASWDSAARERVAFSLGLDYLFLVLYSSTIALGCVGAGTALGRAGSRLADWSDSLAWGQWGAALFDAIENAALLCVLYGSGAAGWPPLAAVCATLKFALLALGLLYAAWGGAVVLGARRQRA